MTGVAAYFPFSDRLVGGKLSTSVRTILKAVIDVRFLGSRLLNLGTSRTLMQLLHATGPSW